MNWMLTGAVILNGLIMHLLPVWQRRNLFFAISVQPDFPNSAAAGKLKNNYRAVVWGATALALGLILALPSERFVAPIYLAQALAALVAFAMIRRKVKSMGVSQPAVHMATLGAEPPQLPGTLFAYMLPLALFAAAAVYLNANWESIPERFPVHWDASGHANRWSAKSPESVYGILGFGASLQVLFLFLIYAMRDGTRRSTPGSSRMRFLEANLGLMLIIQWITAAMFTYIAVMPLRQIQPSGWVIGGLAATLTMVILGAVIYMAKLQAEPAEADNTPDDCWRFGGQVYYNPDDPALMVEKRVGLGFTINFGNKMSWAFLGFTALTMVIPRFLLK